MKQNILIVVDVQNDFVDGALGTPEAQIMLPTLLNKLSAFEGEVVFTRDTHGENYLQTQEGKLLPVPHCIKGTSGWQLVPALQEYYEAHGCKVYDKPSFGSTALANDMQTRYERDELESIELVGLCTDICVVSNALLLKAYCPELPICVDAACCAGVTPEKHEAALETLRSCQILVS